MKIQGSCLCQQVEYEITGHAGIFQYCHCSRCRKFTGSAHAANLFVKPDQFRWVKGENIVGRYEPADAKYFATCFCRQCGSSLPWLSRSGNVVIIPAGTLDLHDQELDIHPQQNIFCASGASWYVAPSSLPMFDEMPPRKSK